MLSERSFHFGISIFLDQGRNEHGPNNRRCGIGENPIGGDDGRKQEQCEKICQAARCLRPFDKKLVLECQQLRRIESEFREESRLGVC